MSDGVAPKVARMPARADFERGLLRQLFALREQRMTSFSRDIYRQPTAHYVDPARFAAESVACFRERPLIAGLGSDLPQAGSFFTVELDQVPVLVVRGEDGQVRAFLNACRHRGSRVAEGRGHAGRVFKCPFHAWTYDIDGRLLGHPLAKSAFAGVEPDAHGLIPLPADEAGGLILVQPNAAGPLDGGAALAGLAPELELLDLGGFRFFDENQSTWAFNWKQPFETFLETYHIFSLHAETLAKEVLSTPMLVETFGPHGRGVLMGRKAIELQAQDESEWRFSGRANLVYWLFPNTVLSLPMTGHAELWQFYPDEGRPDSTRVHMRFYTPGEPDGDKGRAFWRRMFEFTMGVVTTEDFAQQVKIFGNLRSGLLPELVFGRNEPALIHYHECIERTLREDGRRPVLRH